MLTTPTYEIKEVKEHVWGLTLSLFVLACILFYYFNRDISIYIQLFTYILTTIVMHDGEKHKFINTKTGYFMTVHKLKHC